MNTQTFTKEDGTLALLRCPNDHENYAMAVMSGRCAFCDYDANAVTPDAADLPKESE